MSALFRTLAAAPLALAVTLLTAAPVQGAPIYTYVGNNFNDISSSGPTPAEDYTTTDRVRVVFELAAPLAANLSPLTSVSPLSFTLTDGINTITHANATNSSFNVATDASGSIISWWVYAVIYTPQNGGGTAKAVQTNNYIEFNNPFVVDIGQDVLCGPTSTLSSCAFIGDPSYFKTGRIDGAPGVWRLQTTSQVPEPSSLLLVGMAMAGLATRRRVTRAR